MTKRVLARLAIGADELVISLDDRDRFDMRVHTPTGGLHFPSGNGLSIKREHVAALIEALSGGEIREAVAEAKKHAALAYQFAPNSYTYSALAAAKKAEALLRDGGGR